MVVTHGPRGHGGGRAATPEAEATRRARISAAQRGSTTVTLVSSYRLKSRYLRGGKQVLGWNYVSERRYRIRIKTDEAEQLSYDRRAREAVLNERAPWRAHFLSYVESEER